MNEFTLSYTSDGIPIVNGVELEPTGQYLVDSLSPQYYGHEDIPVIITQLRPDLVAGNELNVQTTNTLERIHFTLTSDTLQKMEELGITLVPDGYSIDTLTLDAEVTASLPKERVLITNDDQGKITILSESGHPVVASQKMTFTYSNGNLQTLNTDYLRDIQYYVLRNEQDNIVHNGTTYNRSAQEAQTELQTVFEQRKIHACPEIRSITPLAVCDSDAVQNLPTHKPPAEEPELPPR